MHSNNHQSFQNWLCNRFKPTCLVYSTKAAKSIIIKNNLTPAEFLRPFGDFSSDKINIPFGEKANTPWQSFKLDFYDNDKFTQTNPNLIQDYIYRILSNPNICPNWTLNTPIISKTHHESPSSLFIQNSFLWHKEVEETFFEFLYFNESELFQQPLIHIFVCSLNDNVNVIDTLCKKDNIPTWIYQNIYSVPKATLILIWSDKSEINNNGDSDTEEQEEQNKKLFLNMYRKNYFMIFWNINMNDECSTNCKKDIWSPYFHKIDLYNPKPPGKEALNNNNNNTENHTYIPTKTNLKNDITYGALITEEERVTFKSTIWKFFTTYVMKILSQDVQELEENTKKEESKWSIFSTKKNEHKDRTNIFNIYKWKPFEQNLYQLGIYHFYFQNYQSADIYFQKLITKIKSKSPPHYMALLEISMICQYILNKKDLNLLSVYKNHLNNSYYNKAMRSALIILKIYEDSNRGDEIEDLLIRKIILPYEDIKKKINVSVSKQNILSGSSDAAFQSFSPFKPSTERWDIIKFFKPFFYEKISMYYILEKNQFRKFVLNMVQSGIFYSQTSIFELKRYTWNCYGNWLSFIRDTSNSFIILKDYLNRKMGGICVDWNYMEGAFYFYRNCLELGKYTVKKAIDDQMCYIKYYLENWQKINISWVHQNCRMWNTSKLSAFVIDNAGVWIVENQDFVIAREWNKEKTGLNNLQKGNWNISDNEIWNCFYKYSIVQSHKVYANWDDNDLNILRNWNNIICKNPNFSNYHTKKWFHGNVNESIFVKFTIYNPLNIDLSISSMKLICDYNVKEAKEKEGEYNDKDKDKDKEKGCDIEYEDKSLILKAKTFSVVQLSVTPYLPGEIIWKGIQISLYNIAVIKHYFNSKSSMLWYSYRHKCKQNGWSLRKGSSNSESSQSGSCGHSNRNSTNLNTTGNNMINKNYNFPSKSSSLQWYSYKHEIIYHIKPLDKDWVVFFPLGRTLKMYRHQLLFYPITIVNNTSLRIKRFSIFFNDNINYKRTCCTTLSEYIFKEIDLFGDTHKTEVIIPIIPNEWGKIAIKMLIKFEEELKYKYIEIKRYVININVEEGIITNINEQLFNYAIDSNLNTKELPDNPTDWKQVIFDLDINMCLENPKKLRNWKVGAIYYNWWYTKMQGDDWKEEDIEGIIKMYNKYQFKKMINNNCFNNTGLTYLKPPQDTNTKQNDVCKLDFIPESYLETQPHLVLKFSEWLNKKQIISIPWSAQELENQSTETPTQKEAMQTQSDRMINGWYLYQLKLQVPKVTYSFIKKIVVNSVKLRVTQYPNISLNNTNTLISLELTINKKAIMEIYDISWYEIYVWDNDIKLNWIGWTKYKISNQQFSNKNNEILLCFTCVTAIKGRRDINKISILLHKKEYIDQDDAKIDIKFIPSPLLIDIQ